MSSLFPSSSSSSSSLPRPPLSPLIKQEKQKVKKNNKQEMKLESLSSSSSSSSSSSFSSPTKRKTLMFIKVEPVLLYENQNETGKKEEDHDEEEEEEEDKPVNKKKIKKQHQQSNNDNNNLFTNKNTTSTPVKKEGNLETTNTTTVQSVKKECGECNRGYPIHQMHLIGPEWENAAYMCKHCSVPCSSSTCTGHYVAKSIITTTATTATATTTSKESTCGHCQLREFDYNPKFGPSQAMTRLSRYLRAAVKLKINPPPSPIVLEWIEKNPIYNVQYRN